MDVLEERVRKAEAEAASLERVATTWEKSPKMHGLLMGLKQETRGGFGGGFRGEFLEKYSEAQDEESKQKVLEGYRRKLMVKGYKEPLAQRKLIAMLLWAEEEELL